MPSLGKRGRNQPRETCKRIIKAASITALFCIALTGTALAALTHPQPLFPYHAAHGRLSLYSDRPFDVARADEVFAGVEWRLSRSSLNDGNEHRLLVSNSEWRRRLFFLWNASAAGVNYYPAFRYYDRYRLLVRYVMKQRRWTAAELVASFVPQSEAEAILKTDIERAR